MYAGPLPQGLHDVALAYAAPADQDQVGTAPDEIAGGQFFNLHAVKGFRVELPVEAFQGFTLGETGLPDAARHGAFAAGASLLAQQQIEELKVGEAFFFRPGQ